MNKHKWVSECKKYWGLVPMLLFLIIKLLVYVIGVFTDSVLRSIPRLILSWFGGIAIGLLVFWIGRRLLWKDKAPVSVLIGAVRNGLSVIYWAAVAAAIGIGILLSVFHYHPEYVVEQNGIRMVASVNSFLQERVFYYDYKNVIFCGAEPIDWEDHGNGSGDPFKSDPFQQGKGL